MAVVDEEALLVGVEDGRILAVVDEEALLKGVEVGRLLEELVAVVVGQESIVHDKFIYFTNNQFFLSRHGFFRFHDEAPCANCEDMPDKWTEAKLDKVKDKDMRTPSC